ncbi:hypothetical protein HAX54_001969, partial [Datura stramonium]|nr:hypothetical protein [Datura stramonium]
VKSTERPPLVNRQPGLAKRRLKAGLGARLQATAQNPRFTCVSWVETSEMPMWNRKRNFT